MENLTLQFSQDDIESVKQAALSSDPVSGYTHTFYRYPARFSPQFARAAISSLTEPGDLVLDPFMGGGTTLVEAMALGRRAIGTDISSLATFVSTVKTSLLSKNDRKVLDEWIECIPNIIRLNRTPKYICTPHDIEYQRNLNNPEAWRIRKGIKLALESLQILNNSRQEQFARCVLLKTSQWALDGRKEIPSIKAYREMLLKHFDEMRQGEIELYTATKDVSNHNIFSARKAVKCINRSVIGLEQDQQINTKESPRLILTSPPYPGIHVLYHRWQVNGRRETPIPFLIANKLDGAGASFYTLGSRNHKNLKIYFSQITDAFSSLAAISGPDTTIVQMVSFAEPEWQLPKYLEAMENAGLTEVYPNEINSSTNGRIWRDVPQRKWHANFIGKTEGSKEVVLFHRLHMRGYYNN